MIKPTIPSDFPARGDNFVTLGSVHLIKWDELPVPVRIGIVEVVERDKEARTDSDDVR